jgi:hypothetical protein
MDVPAERMKARREHRVPLSVPAVKLLRSLPRILGEEFLFLGAPGKHRPNMALLELLRRMGRDDITVHGFRSTFRDWAAECTNFSRKCAKWRWRTQRAMPSRRLIAGVIFLKRRMLISQWASYCGSNDRCCQITLRSVPEGVPPFQARDLVRE